MTYIKDHQVTYARQVPVTHTSRKITPRFLVMHYTAGFSAESAIHAYRSRRVSAHLTVDLDGTVYQHVPYNVAAWHAGKSRHMGYNGLNGCSIGIEIVNAGWFRKDGNMYYRDRLRKSANQMPPMEPHAHSRVGGGTFWWPKYTEQQLEVLDDLTRDILEQYNILDIVSHEEIDTRGWKTDPGPAFPMDRYTRLLHTANLDRDEDGDPHQVAASKLNVRQGPGTLFDIMDTVYRGDIVEVVDRLGNWARINQDGNDDGWVHDAYIRRF